MNSTALARINLAALQHNLRCVRDLMPDKKILAMIKSNAYGHGFISVAKAIADVDALGVATLSEAVQLRQVSVQTDLVVMRGFATDVELSAFLNDSHLIACVHNVEQIQLLENQPRDAQKKVRIWLKIETGMHRLGVLENEFQACFSRLNALSIVEKPFVICSHLADADNIDHTVTKKQITRFDRLTKNIRSEKSLLNSAGILSYGESAHEWIRPGLMLYGVSPFEWDDHSHDNIISQLKPVMTLESRLISVKTVEAGEKIGYSCTYTAPDKMKIGIIGMGYGDSYPRHAKNGTPVLIRGQRCPIVGRVSMDMITVDVTRVADVAMNDTVILWGNNLLVAEIAHHVGTTPHELLCHLTGRVQMEVVFRSDMFDRSQSNPFKN